MEIKVVCVCGQKFKFDVEPVNGRMPYTVRCPVCNADGTAQANQIIQQAGTAVAQPAASSAVPVARIISVSPPAAAPGAVSPAAPAISVSTVPRVASTPPSATAAPAAPAVPAGPARVALRVNTPSPAPSAPAPASPIVPAASHSVKRPDADGEEAENSGEDSGGIRELRLSWTTKFWILLFILLVVGNIGWKLYRKGRTTVSLAGSVSDLVVNTVSKEEQSLWADDTVVLIIKHPSEKEVADACVEFWRDKLKKPLTAAPAQEFFPEEGQRAVLSPVQGCVQVVGPIDWAKPQTAELSQFLSQKLNTLLVESRDYDSSGAYVFAVFDQGQQKCRVELELVPRGKTLADGFDNKFSLEGEPWAAEHGVKMSAKAGAQSNLGSWEKIMKSIGIKVGDWKGHPQVLLLKEAGAARKKP